MNSVAVRTILVPGAWMGAWIWEPTVQLLAERGCTAETITLRGLEAEQSKSAVAAVRLEDHVQQLVTRIQALPGSPVVLVSHSYSGIPATLAADRLGSRVCGLVHLGGFVPMDGHSMLDDWGDSDEARTQERRDIAAAGDVWMPPERWMLDHESDLTVQDRDFLAARFTPHPGHTITDAAGLSAPAAEQPTTYVALSPRDENEAWREAPQVARSASNWRHRYLRSGHWPMLSIPAETADLIADEVGFYGATRA